MTRVLIVDDNAQNLYLLRVLLEGEGCSVDEARHGAEALVKARLAPPDLVVSDLLMPVLDGYTLLRHWKADDKLQHIPFIVYTATYTDPKDERLALALGADAFIVKPCEPDSLMAQVHDVLARVQRGEAATVSELPIEEGGVLADYNEVLVRKLEKRARQLEERNRELLATIAECKRTEAALQESEERFRATFEQAAVGIAHIDVDGKFLRVNDKLCEMTGYQRGELLQMTFVALTFPDDRAESDDARRAMLVGSQALYAKEKRYQRKGGDPFWVNVVSSLPRDQAGQPTYFITVITDITERKALEDQLRQAQKLESIGQLTGGIAHDFNNLLTVIIGNAEMLADRLAADSGLRPLTEMTLTAAQRGADLTQRLLAFARRQALDPRAVDVNALLRSMESMLRRTLAEDISVVFLAGEGLSSAVVDAAQLQAAVLNLSINARDAMPGGGSLTIETANVQLDDDQARQADVTAGDYVLIAVSDTGTGIAPAHLSHVFEPFFTTKPVGKGTGLGLSMVYGFVKQSRGHVKVYSEPGHGTTVKVYLPRAGGLDEAEGVDAAPSLASLHGSETILLVEDDALVRQYAEQQLCGLGYRVVSASDGVAAMGVLTARNDIDLLFTDVVMPGGLNGRQLADAAWAVKPGLKVLFSSGYTENAIVHHGRLDRGAHLLSKPYGRLELARKVRETLAAPAAPLGEAGRRQGPGRLLVLDDDPFVGEVLGMAAQKLGFQSELTSKPRDFFSRVVQWQPSHVAIDLSMPDMSGLQVLSRLAEIGCDARVIVTSGADPGQMQAALDRAHALGLNVVGLLPKPFSAPALRALLVGEGDR